MSASGITLVPKKGTPGGLGRKAVAPVGIILEPHRLPRGHIIENRLVFGLNNLLLRFGLADVAM